MKISIHKTAVILTVLLLLSSIVSLGLALKWGREAAAPVSTWDLKWSSALSPDLDEIYNPSGSVSEEWVTFTEDTQRTEVSDGKSSLWLRIPLPNISDQYALLIEKVYGNDIEAYVNNVRIYNSHGKDNYNGAPIMLPLSQEHSGELLYLWSSGEKRVGIEGGMVTGKYDEILALYVRQDFMDIILGASLIFMGAVFAVCSIFMKRELFYNGFFLVLIILSSGVLVITYSPFLPLLLNNSGRVVNILFDLSLFTLMLSFTIFFERIFGSSTGGAIIKARKLLIGYSIACGCVLILSFRLPDPLDGLYKYMTVNVAGVIMSLLLLLLLSLAVSYAIRGNRDAMIFSAGFGFFSILSLAEIIMFYVTAERYHLYWWKWGVVILILSLIIILGRGFVRSHQQVVQYSRELEKFNNDLQRSEKMGIISDLAASVAHEVRNPLQVTRGFLQLLGERSGQKEKEYLEIAVAELDRASHIITDFLTFAKPEMEKLDLLDVSTELKHVAGILNPLANLQSAEIVLKLQDGLYIQGSSSKLKQAFINLIKNSIESLLDNGIIIISMWQSGKYIIVSVRDNGGGMKSSELARLGEPYYSNKTKGTGLGLMVTFRIIEALGGTIQFHSQLGEGTEVIVKLPAVHSTEI